MKNSGDNRHDGDADVAALKGEIETLSQQVKRLVKVESNLYRYQEELDAQLKEYKNLYELNKKLNETFDTATIFQYTVDYLIQNLDYERAVVFDRDEGTGYYKASASGGYYNQEEKATIGELVIKPDDPLLSAVRAGGDVLLCMWDSESKELVAFRAQVLLHEYAIYRLGTDAHPHALVVVGNSADNAEFYRKMDDTPGTLVSMGNVMGLLSSSLDKNIYYQRMGKAVEQERLAEQKYRSIFENAVEGMFQKNLTGIYLDVNPSMARMLGFPSPEAMIAAVADMKLHLFVQPERQVELIRLLEEHGAVEGFEVQMHRQDGRDIWVSVCARMVRDSSGKALYYEGTAEQITARKRAEEATARLAAIVESAEDAIFSENAEGFIQTWNLGAERLFGYRSEDVLGKHVSILLPSESHGELEEMTRKMKEGIQDHFETIRVTKDGKRIFVSLTMSPIKDPAGQVVGVSKIAHDISQKKVGEENLKQTVRALEQSNRELKQFAYVASHDLQEPLRNVKRYVELFAREYKGHIDQKADEYLRFAVEGAERIHSLISDLLLFSEVGAEARELKPVSMQEVTEDAMANLRESIERCQAAITVDAMPQVYGDKGLLVQLLQNLMNNAIKFRKENVPTRIHISARYSPDEWLFGVHDNGIGIEPEYHDKIFIIFQRLHSRSEYTGTGIGLAICRKIVEWHGGKIWVRSNYGEGSSFYFTIPSRVNLS